MAVAGLMFAGCSNNDVKKDIEEENVAIAFDNDFINKTTKSEIADLAALKLTAGIGVQGLKGTQTIFNNEKVSWTTNWTHTTVRFWDKSANDYAFYAYAPYSATAATFGTTGWEYSLGTQAAIATDADAAIDLLIAEAHEGKSYASYASSTDHRVNFTFHHALSKLSVKAKTGTDAATAKIIVTKVEMAFPNTEGAKWTQTAKNALPGTPSYTSYTMGTTSYTTVFDKSSNTTELTGTAASLGDEAKSYIITPYYTSGAYAEVTIPVKVTYTIKYVKDSVTETDCVSTGTATIKFLQDYYYNLVLTVGPEAIEFTVDKVCGWDQNGNSSNPGDSNYTQD